MGDPQIPASPGLTRGLGRLGAISLPSLLHLVVRGQVVPVRVQAFYQFHLSRSPPALDRGFAPQCGLARLVALPPDQSRAVVARGEPLFMRGEVWARGMVGGPAVEVVGMACVEHRAPRVVGDDVDVEGDGSRSSARGPVAFTTRSSRGSGLLGDWKLFPALPTAQPPEIPRLAADVFGCIRPGLIMRA